MRVKNGRWSLKLNAGRLLCAKEGSVTLNYDALCIEMWVFKEVKKSW